MAYAEESIHSSKHCINIDHSTRVPSPSVSQLCTSFASSHSSPETLTEKQGCNHPPVSIASPRSTSASVSTSKHNRNPVAFPTRRRYWQRRATGGAGDRECRNGLSKAGEPCDVLTAESLSCSPEVRRGTADGFVLGYRCICQTSARGIDVVLRRINMGDFPSEVLLEMEASERPT